MVDQTAQAIGGVTYQVMPGHITKSIAILALDADLLAFSADVGGPSVAVVADGSNADWHRRNRVSTHDVALR